MQNIRFYVSSGECIAHSFCQFSGAVFNLPLFVCLTLFSAVPGKSSDLFYRFNPQYSSLILGLKHRSFLTAYITSPSIHRPNIL